MAGGDVVTELAMRQEISGPGVYDRMPEGTYHSDPAPAATGGSLSSTGARKLIQPGTPAGFDYWRNNPEPPSDTFDFGRAAHRYVLTEGAALHVVDAGDWRTNAAKAERDQARAAGRIPILPKHVDTVKAMAAQIRAHPWARRLLDPARGRPEQSLFWLDDTGVYCRARVDLLPHPVGGRRFVLADYKTTKDASRDAIMRSLWDHRYDVQDAWYRAAVRALGLADDPEFVFVFQEKTPPYLVNVVELDRDTLLLGRRGMRHAIDLFASCTRSGQWPGYPVDIDVVGMPAWVLNREGIN